MIELFLRGAGALDALRGRALPPLLRPSLVRGIYLSRPHRLALLFTLSFALDAVLALRAPVLVLLLGPLVLGIPHLAASWRFTTQMLRRGTGSEGLAAIFAAVVAFRLLVDFGGAPVPDWFFHGGEWVAFAATYLVFRRSPGPGPLADGIAAGLLGAAMLWPLGTVITLLLAHNAVGFLYWYRASAPEERWVSTTAALAFAGFHALLAAGSLDGLLAAQAGPRVGDFIVRDLFRLLGDAIDPRAIERFLCAYAFGQAMHYYVWLKAIPEQLHPERTSPSYRQSLAALRSDLGSRGAALVLAASLAFPLLLLPLGGEQCRRLYFVIAAYHGFMELAGVPRLLSRRRA